MRVEIYTFDSTVLDIYSTWRSCNCSRATKGIDTDELQRIQEHYSISITVQPAQKPFFGTEDLFSLTNVSALPPSIVSRVCPTRRCHERHIWVRLPSNITVILANVFILDSGGCREVDGDTPSRVIGGREQECIIWRPVLECIH
jgi:hypothetical protein